VQNRLGYNDYAFLTGAIRADNISAFGDNQGFIISPSVNASVVISDMPFWSFNLIDNLRLRGGWGKAAQAPDPFAADRTLQANRLSQDGELLTGVTPLDPGNPELTAERNREVEVGVDMSLIDNRIGFNFAYWDQKTTDAILATNVSPGTGFPGQRFVNIAGLENSGIEVSLSVDAVERNNIDWDVTIQASTQDPIVTDMGDQEPILLGAQVDGMFHEGFAPGAYYGPKVVNAERDENGDIIDESIEFAPGNLDIPGRPNFRAMGQPNPKNRQNVSTTFRLFDDLSIYALFQRVGGLQKMNDTRGTRTPFIEGISGSREFAFRQAESSPEIQAAMELDIADAAQVFVEDADFVRWREFRIGYDLPQNLWNTPVVAARVSVGVRNLALWTDYSGFDPEATVGGGSDNFTTGSFFTQPQPRSFFGTLTLTF